MDSKMAVLKYLKTWVTVPCLPSKNIISWRWVFRLKKKADGAINKHKACLVTCRFIQVYGIGYCDTYLPVVMPFVISWCARSLVLIF
jgi:hypothetical protein